MKEKLTLFKSLTAHRKAGIKCFSIFCILYASLSPSFGEIKAKNTPKITPVYKNNYSLEIKDSLLKEFGQHKILPKDFEKGYKSHVKKSDDSFEFYK